MYTPTNTWITGEKFEETKLPPKEAFYSKLTMEGITDKDYEHAQKVWDVFCCKSMKDYHDLYLKTDVLLLTCVFEKFREMCLKNYQLDPAHFFTAPGTAWCGALKYTGIHLQLFNNDQNDMLSNDRESN